MKKQNNGSNHKKRPVSYTILVNIYSLFTQLPVQIDSTPHAEFVEYT